MPGALKIAVHKETVQQCGVCGCWTRNGDNFPSGNRDPRTGETPVDNFVCDRCQEEARAAHSSEGLGGTRERLHFGLMFGKARPLMQG